MSSNPFGGFEGHLSSLRTAHRGLSQSLKHPGFVPHVPNWTLLFLGMNSSEQQTEGIPVLTQRAAGEQQLGAPEPHTLRSLFLVHKTQYWSR